MDVRHPSIPVTPSQAVFPTSTQDILSFGGNKSGVGMNNSLSGKINRTTVTVPPLPQAPLSPISLMTSSSSLNNSVRSLVHHQLNSSNPGVSNTLPAHPSDLLNSRIASNCTSSFAAALRNLAKQAGEPTSDSHPSSLSPHLNHTSCRITKSGLQSLLTSTQSTPPIVTIAPTQSFMTSKENTYSLGNLIPEIRQGMPNTDNNSILRSNAFFESLSRNSSMGISYTNPENYLQSHLTNAIDSFQGFYSFDQGKTNIFLNNLRGFQPYRNDSAAAAAALHSHLAVMDPATYSAYQAAYLAAHFPPTALRLEEQLYLEQLGLLRPQLFGFGIPSVSPYIPPELLINPFLINPTAPTFLHERLETEQQRLTEINREKDRQRDKEHERSIRSNDGIKNDRDRSPLRYTSESPHHINQISANNRSTGLFRPHELAYKNSLEYNETNKTNNINSCKSHTDNSLDKTSQIKNETVTANLTEETSGQTSRSCDTVLEQDSQDMEDSQKFAYKIYSPDVRLLQNSSYEVNSSNIINSISNANNLNNKAKSFNWIMLSSWPDGQFLNSTISYPQKVIFLQQLCLKPLTNKEKKAREEIWQCVMQESFRRKQIFSRSNIWNLALNYNEESDSVFDSCTEDKCYSWPGVDIIVDAYRRYTLEQQLEKKILTQQCYQSHQHKLELENFINCLSAQLSNLICDKEKIKKHSNYLQQCLDQLMESMQM